MPAGFLELPSFRALFLFIFSFSSSRFHTAHLVALVEAAGEAIAKELDARRWWRVRKVAAAAEAVEW